MEAALRTAAEELTGKPLDNVEFKEVRGIEGIKEAEYDLNGVKVKVAVASGLTNAKKLCDKIKAGECDYTFVEVMCCPGGCVNGGGQPIQSAYTRRQVDLRAARAKALYDEDAAAAIRQEPRKPRHPHAVQGVLRRARLVRRARDPAYLVRRPQA